tara:strand:+ start:2008 stop:2691 length:684 start_codon:yes stop_codon:yes gene_type:complete
VQHIVLLTGAGISADSGLKTFRDAGGLWEGHRIDEVASIDGWNQDKQKVLNFYNRRREQASKAKPNEAHHSITKLEKKYRVSVITQNVDDLHERAGNSTVLHLHGLLREARSEVDETLITDIGANAINIGDFSEDGSQLRPNIVWFGEPVPNIEKASYIVAEADILMVVGTSLAVYPAASLIHYTKKSIPKYIVDPKLPEISLSDEWTHIQNKAKAGLPELVNQLIK